MVDNCLVDDCQKRLLAAEIERLREALMPFAHYFEQNDCDERRDDDALEVPIGDLRRARAALTSTDSGGPTASAPGASTPAQRLPE